MQFILSASYEFHFSHRILFFLQSILFDKLEEDKTQIQKTCIDKVVEGLLKQIDVLDERLFLSNSHDYERLLQTYNLIDF